MPASPMEIVAPVKQMEKAAFRNTAHLDQLLARIEREPSYSAYQNAGRALEGLDPETWGMKPIRVALISSWTVDPLVAYLRVELYRCGLGLQCFTAPYERFGQEMMDPASRLIAFKPDVVFADIEPASLLPNVAKQGLRLCDVEALLERIETLVTAFRRHCPALIALHNFINLRPRPFAIVKTDEQVAFEALNRALLERFRSASNVMILDADGLTSYHGKEQSLDSKLRYLAGIKYGETFLPLLAKSYAITIHALQGRARKCLVLDLDNTLWGGIVGEVGCDGILLGPSASGLMYMDFQRAVLQFHQSGVLLAISSKNNPEEALAALREHPHMILREEHFSSIQIGWDPKPEHLKRIAEELNIGRDSLVFIDDDPVECAQMRHYLPEVRTIQFPKDPSEALRTLLTLADFERLRLTDEDRQRNRMYVEQRRRDQFREQTGSFEDFLRGLKMAAVIRVNWHDDIERVSVLTQKTNQFTLTTKRYTVADIEAMMESPATYVYSLRLTDIFGDNGLIGVAIIREAADEIWEIDSFLLSCRAIGKKVESVFLGEIVRDAQRAGMQALCGFYVRTPKNGLVQDFYSQEGFHRKDGSEQAWRLDLDGGSRAREEWIEVRRR